MRILFVVTCLAAAVFMQGSVSFGDEDLDDPNLRVSEGRVISVDRSGQSITVDAGMPMIFPLSAVTVISSSAKTVFKTMS